MLDVRVVVDVGVGVSVDVVVGADRRELPVSSFQMFGKINERHSIFSGRVPHAY